MKLTTREKERLITLVSAEIMKSHLHYGHNHPNTNALYALRDKIIAEEPEDGNIV